MSWVAFDRAHVDRLGKRVASYLSASGSSHPLYGRAPSGVELRSKNRDGLAADQHPVASQFDIHGAAAW